MKRIYLILQSVFFVAALCVGFTSCNSEDDELSASNKLMSKKWVYTDAGAGEWSEGAYVQSSSYCLYFLDGQYGVNSWYEKEVDSYFGTDKESGYDFFEYTIQGNSIVIKYFEGGRFDGRKQTFTINGSSIKSDGDTYYAQDYNYSEIRNLEKELAEKLGTASYNTDDKIFTVGGVSFTMKKVTGGTFTMGATSEQGSDAFSDEKPHQVTLSSYYIGETEVTQALWQAVMGNNISHFKGNNLPVDQANWDDCQRFIRKLNSMTGQNFRLPTEAEWEFAARGGNKSNSYMYSGSYYIGDVAWYVDNCGDKTHIVKSKSHNELGIYDMSGNVCEWCSDWYGSYSSNAQTNPTGPSTGSSRVHRGGGWSYIASACRVSQRFYENPNIICSYAYPLGLRLACGDDTAGGTPENGNDNIATILGQWRLNFDQNSYVLLTFNQDGTMRYYEYDKNKVEEDKTYTYAYSDGWLQISKESKSIQVIKLTSTELILKDWPDGGSNIFTKVK